MPGGGTVAYVNPSEHVYLTDIEHREEGGTPAIVESIRAGLVFELKEAVGADAIREREESFIHRAIERWSRPPEHRDPRQPRRSTGCRSCRSSSCRCRAAMGHAARYLHHNFVVALLNDLFGIQSRGGCSCAGPYGHRLLGIDLETSHEFEREIARGCEGIKPGWVRVNFNYFISEAVFEFILEAVELVASDGWRLLPHYRFEPATGLWRHAGGHGRAADEPARRPLRRRPDALAVAPPDRARVGAGRLPRRGPPASWPTRRRRPSTPEHLVVDDDFETLRWFPLPDEIALPVR